MRTLVEKLERAMTLLAVASTFLMLALTTLNALGRYLFRLPITGTYEVTEQYIMVFSVFLALTYTYREGTNIRVTSVVSRLPARARLAVNYFVQVVAILFGMSLLVGTAVFTLRRIDERLVITDFSIPLLPAYIGVLVGLLSLTVRMVLDLRHVGRGDSGLLKEEKEEF